MTLVLLSVLALLAMLAAAAAVAWALHLQREQLQLHSELQASRAQAQALAGALDVWQWRSDAQHRLTLLRPPSTASSRWPDVNGKPLLWEHFQSDDNAALRADPGETIVQPSHSIPRRTAHLEHASIDTLKWQIGVA